MAGSATIRPSGTDARMPRGTAASSGHPNSLISRPATHAPNPANAICATDLYVRIAIGLDYLEAAPVRGSYYGAAEERMDVSLKIDGARQTQS